ncbi:hypothetical protein TNCV_3747121 [Trichonephila clavipes]|nr:hypothetical protein TNCV_3747121 [Trichonephila clavipes]
MSKKGVNTHDVCRSIRKNSWFSNSKLIGIKRFLRNHTSHAEGMFDHYLAEYLWRLAITHSNFPEFFKSSCYTLPSTWEGSTIRKTATAGSDVVQSGRPIFDDFFQHLWPYIGNNTANVVFQMVKRLWLICIDQ